MASAAHTKLASKFVKNQEYSTFHDKALWFVREKRDKMMYAVNEWEELRDTASKIKEHTLEHLAHYLSIFEAKALDNGIQVHWAEDAEEHNKIVLDIITKAKAKKIVKSKSMLMEECDMNPYLEERGFKVIETDLGERIIQLQDAKPSHIVMPAIHLKRQTVGELFEKHLYTEPGNSDPTYLTKAARRHLREEFLTADVAMTGVNFGIADEGIFVVCTNEGNADMGVHLSPIHIASMGIEKLIPDLSSLAVFTRLLARSATGQPITTYTSHFQKPANGQEIHLILVDNGRTRLVIDKAHKNILKCIRCAACMNTCPVYRRSGGYSYSYFIPGPIGINIGMSRDPKAYKGDLSACSLCYSCSNVCPVKIDLADQIYAFRQELGKTTEANQKKKSIVKKMQFVLSSPKRFHLALKYAKFLNLIPSFVLNSKWLSPWAKYHKMPSIPKKSFHQLWKKGQVK